MKLYDERDAFELDQAGKYYSKHIVAMTKEGLETKGDVAAELGHRDMLIDQLQAQVEQLKHELTLSTDQNDLLLDEFVRVKHLTDNTEIRGLCERAHVRMRQRVSVIDRNFNQAQEIKELKAQVEQLLYQREAMAETIYALKHENEKLEAQVNELRGLKPSLPESQPSDYTAHRYGIRWNGPTQPLIVPMEDGYWTPWHLADIRLIEIKAQVEQLQHRINDLKAANKLSGKCLAEIKAQAVEHFGRKIINHFEGCDYNLTRQTLEAYINEQIRQADKGKK